MEMIYQKSWEVGADAWMEQGQRINGEREIGDQENKQHYILS